MLSPTAEAVLLALAEIPAATQVKQSTLAKRASCSTRSVIRAIRDLRDRRFIECWQGAAAGPDSVYTFQVTEEGRSCATFLRIALFGFKAERVP